jgi:hypothetical protein
MEVLGKDGGKKAGAVLGTPAPAQRANADWSARRRLFRSPDAASRNWASDGAAHSSQCSYSNRTAGDIGGWNRFYV